MSRMASRLTSHPVELDPEDIILTVKPEYPDVDSVECSRESSQNIANMVIKDLIELASKCADPNATYTTAFVNLTRLLQHALEVLRGKKTPQTVFSSDAPRQSLELFNKNPPFFAVYARKGEQQRLDVKNTIEQCFKLLNGMMADPHIKQHLFSNTKLFAKAKAKLEKARRDAEKAEEDRRLAAAAEAEAEAEQKRLAAKAAEELKQRESVDLANRLAREEAERNALQKELDDFLDQSEGLNETSSSSSLEDAIQNVKKFETAFGKKLTQDMEQTLIFEKKRLGILLEKVRVREERQRDAVNQLRKAQALMRDYETKTYSLHERKQLLDQIHAEIRKIPKDLLPAQETQALNVLSQQYEDAWKKYKTDYEEFMATIQTKKEEFAKRFKEAQNNPNLATALGAWEKLQTDVGKFLKIVNIETPVFASEFERLYKEVQSERQKPKIESAYQKEVDEMRSKYDGIAKKSIKHTNVQIVLVSRLKKSLDDLKNASEKSLKTDKKVNGLRELYNALNDEGIDWEALNSFFMNYEKYIMDRSTKNYATLTSVGRNNPKIGPVLADLLKNWLDENGPDPLTEKVMKLKAMLVNNGTEEPSNPLTYSYIVNAHNKKQEQMLGKYIDRTKDVNTFVNDLLETHSDDADFIRNFNDIMDKHRSIYASIQTIDKWIVDRIPEKMNKKNFENISRSNLMEYLEALMKQYAITYKEDERINDLAVITKLLKTPYISVFTNPLDIQPEWIPVLTNLDTKLKGIASKLSNPKPKGQTVSIPVGPTRKLRGGGVLTPSFALITLINTLIVSVTILAVSIYVSEQVRKKVAKSKHHSDLFGYGAFFAMYAALLVVLGVLLRLDMDIMRVHLGVFLGWAVVSVGVWFGWGDVRMMSLGAIAIGWVLSMFWAVLVEAV